MYKSTKIDYKFPATKITLGIVQLTNLFLQCEHHVFVTLNVIKKNVTDVIKVILKI